MELYKPPEFPCRTLTKPSIFLAGSIEQGAAELWQDKVIQRLKYIDCIVFNPRRDNWDSNLPQSIDCPEFVKQVTWELEHIEYADIIFFYFDPNTKSPISLLELGLSLNHSPFSLIIVCPDGFYRKGNILLTAEIYGHKVFNSLENGIKELIKLVYKKKIKYPN